LGFFSFYQGISVGNGFFSSFLYNFFEKNINKNKKIVKFTLENVFLANFFVKKWQIFTRKKKPLSVGASSLAKAHHHYHHSKYPQSIHSINPNLFFIIIPMGSLNQVWELTT